MDILKGKKLKPINKRKSNLKTGLFLCSILAYPLLNFIVFYLLVNINSFTMAFQQMDTNLNTTWVGLENFKNFFQTLRQNGNIYLVSFRNSLILFAGTLIPGFIFNMLFSFYVFKKCRGHSAFKLIFMIPAIMSSMIIGLMFQRFLYAIQRNFMNAGVTGFPEFFGSKYGLFTVIFYCLWAGFGSSVIIYSNAMGGISKEIFESAQVDGASYWKQLLHIVIPLIMPTITTYTVTGVAGILVTQGPLYLFWEYEAPAQTSIIGYLIFQTTMRSGATQYPAVAALGVICTLISLPVTLLVRFWLQKLDPTK